MILHYSDIFSAKSKGFFLYFFQDFLFGIGTWIWAAENLASIHDVSLVRGTRHMDKGYSSLGHVRPVLASKVCMVIKSSKFSLKSADNVILFGGTRIRE